MDSQLALICLLTFVIHLIGTLAYSVRIAGVRTRRVAISFALFNVLVLVSRTSNSFQAPFLAKRVERNLLGAASNDLASDFRWLLVTATLATLVGAFLIPTSQRIFSRAVLAFQTQRSLPRLLLHGFSRGGIAHFMDAVSLPVRGNLSSLKAGLGISPAVFILNGLAVALWTVGVFAALYAGFLKPELRVTSSNLAAVINGVATVLMFIVIDPQLSVMTDDVIEGKTSEAAFRKTVVWLTGSRLAGTVIAQWLLFPAAALIAQVAELL
jgi:hypothetical protein